MAASPLRLQPCGTATVSSPALHSSAQPSPVSGTLAMDPHATLAGKAQMTQCLKARQFGRQFPMQQLTAEALLLMRQRNERERERERNSRATAKPQESIHSDRFNMSGV